MERMQNTDLKKLIPFGIASSLVLAHIVLMKLFTPDVTEYGENAKYLISDEVQYGGFGLAIVLTLVLVKKEIWKYVFALVALLASISVISFFHQRFHLRIGMVQWEIVSLFILIGHLSLNPEVFAPLKYLFKSVPESEEAQRARFEAAVEQIEARFANKPTEELQMIVEQNVLVPAAVEAARRLLERR